MTDLVGGVRISKTDIRLEAYGTVDELSSHLGLLAAMLTTKLTVVGADPAPASMETDLRPELANDIIRIQNNLFNVCSHLATDQSQTPLYPSAHLAEGETEYLEQRIDTLNAMLPEPQGFILPGGSIEASQAHVCRTVCRRAERRIDALAEVATVGQEIVQYVNRLSDYLFVLAKIINFNIGKSEIIWQKAL